MLKKTLFSLALATALSGCSSYSDTIPDRPVQNDIDGCLEQLTNDSDEVLFIEIPVAPNFLANAVFTGIASVSKTAEAVSQTLRGARGRAVMIYGANEGNNTAMLRAALKTLPEARDRGEICLTATPERGKTLQPLASSRGYELILTREGI